MSDQELARDLGLLEAYTIGLGTMIGAGVFVLPSLAAEQAGPASMLSFFVGGLISLLAALSLSELATGMPKAGGSYYYVNRALGPFFGSIVGLGMWAGLTFASAFYMIGFGQYLLPGLGEYLGFLSGHGELGITVAALVMAGILTGVNYYGVKETGALQNVIVLTLVGLIVAFLSLGFIGGPQIGAFLPPEGWPAVAATVGTVYVTFIGFEVIATSAEEIKNPSRNLPLSMIAAVVTPTLMYVGVMYVSTGTLSIDALAASQVPVADGAGPESAGGESTTAGTPDEPEEIVVLAGEGPHAPVAARRAVEYARARGEDAVEVTFLNVQTVSEDDDEADSIADGEATIEEMVERAGVEDLEYESRVLTTDEDVRPFILEHVDEYDTVCVGATRTGAVSQALFGSIPEAIGEQSEGRVVMARGPEQAPRTVRDAIVERIAG